MLSKEETGFVQYWEQNRLKKKKIWRQLSVGLPLGVALCGAILVSVYSGWNVGGELLDNNNGTRLVERDSSAAALFRHNKERFFMLLIGVLLVVAFIVIFSARHRWDQNEQHYRELLAKRDKS